MDQETTFDWQVKNPLNWPEPNRPGFPKDAEFSKLHILGPFADRRYQIFKWVPKVPRSRVDAHWEAFGSTGHIPAKEMAESIYVGRLSDYLLGIEDI